VSGTPPAVAGVAVEHRFVAVRGARLHVAEAGEGPPLVLLHGWPQHWWSWRAVLGPLAERHRVLCPDVRGLGWSDGADGSFRLDALVADLLGALDALGVAGPVHLVGHDWGSAIGYRACVLRPDRFARFVALAGVHLWQGRRTPPAGFLAPWHIYAITALGERAAGPLARRALRAWRHAGAFTAGERSVYLDRFRDAGPRRATTRYDRSIVLREIPRAIRHAPAWRLRVPTLHLNGAEDPLTPHVPPAAGIRLDELPGCGHFIPEEAPDRLLERLLTPAAASSRRAPASTSR
jgi:pimeloyl-ACP methyl ester carboxylesterase